MKDTYLAIFGADQSALTGLKELLNTEDGVAQAKEWFRKKLERLVEKKFATNFPDEEIPWWINHITTSNLFFEKLNPDSSLKFQSRMNINLVPEGVILPNGTWTYGNLEETMNPYKEGFVFVFFTIDF